MQNVGSGELVTTNIVIGDNKFDFFSIIHTLTLFTMERSHELNKGKGFE